MNGMIKKIDFIKRMAVFDNFRWSSFVGDDDKRIDEFKKINIIYGHNYSGKTTLSRIFRALETGRISDKYISPEFCLSLEDGDCITQNSLRDHGQAIRVFNEDFVRENLRFIADSEQGINAFALLGNDNAKLEDEIEECEAELDGEEGKSGLLAALSSAEEAFTKAKKNHDDRQLTLEDKLRDKANNKTHGVKHNKLFGDAIYNVNKIKDDILRVSKSSYSPIGDDEIHKLQTLLREEPKPIIPELQPLRLQYAAIALRAEELIEKSIEISRPIQELLNDTALEKWVHTGRVYHQNKRSTCAFCGSDIPGSLWDKLDKHFNKESEDLREALRILLSDIDSEHSRASSFIKIKKSLFYHDFANELEELEKRLLDVASSYRSSLDIIKLQVNKRIDNIFTPFTFSVPESFEKKLDGLWHSLKQLINDSNKFASSLGSKQSQARRGLLLQEVYKFKNDIKYENEVIAIKTLKEEEAEAERLKKIATEKVKAKYKEIDKLKSQLKNESKAAELVNSYLNDSFGHQFLFLKVIEGDLDESSSGCRFEVYRNDKKAFHLSEGECSLIAFCYFMAKLEDVDTKGNQPIIWIDDPISSLDANHIFFVYSLINARIVASKKCTEGEPKEFERFKQLFIFTHNLDFLKYLKRLPGALDNNLSQYFIIVRSSQTSDITLMPKYLKDYVTEFNFLFHQIYRCANAQVDSGSNHDCYYNFGNSARKFLEAFLYYKYPNAIKRDDKLTRFFGEDSLAVSLLDRINNEFSHLAGTIERSTSPVDVPEMKTAANFILKTIKEKDPDQYEALLESIGESKK